MKNSKELLRIDPQTKERWQWIRYDHRSFDEPTGRYVCTHLKPGVWEIGSYDECAVPLGPEEQFVEDLAEIASGDPSALDCHYTVRLCAVCADIYQANVDRRNQRIRVKPMQDELRGYLMGLEDGYVQSKLEGDEERFLDMGEFDALHKQAHAFADSKGKQLYSDFVDGVNFNPDGTRSRGWFPTNPGAKPRRSH